MSDKEYIETFEISNDVIKQKDDGKRIQSEKSKNEEDLGPQLKGSKKIKYDDLEVLSENLPNSEMYEKSYMHRDQICKLGIATESEMVITCSIDGHIKFWKKNFKLVDFVKHFKAHRGRIGGLSVSEDMSLACTTGTQDRSLKIYDLKSTDLINIIKLDFEPTLCEIFRQQKSLKMLVAVGNKSTHDIHILDETIGNENKCIHIIHLHQHRLVGVRYNRQFQLCLSVDEQGQIEYWNTTNYVFPMDRESSRGSMQLMFNYKSSTHLYTLQKQGEKVTGFALGNTGFMFVVATKSQIVYVFQFQTGVIVQKFDESIQFYYQQQPWYKDTQHKQLEKEGKEQEKGKGKELEKGKALEKEQIYECDILDFERRVALEKEVEKTDDLEMDLQFDEEDKVLIFGCMLGVKVVSIKTKKVLCLLGKQETERFLKVSLYQGKAMKNTKGQTGNQGIVKEVDPILICSAFKKHRVYLFSRREPEDIQPASGGLQNQGDKATGRDVFNEKPNKEDQQLNQLKKNQVRLGTSAMIQTTMGDIHVKLFSEEVPKTVDNFIQLAKKGYYIGMKFHRVIKGFMVQTGCPQGDGTGGESAWGGEFEDEFHPALRHDRPFTLSMANAGPNTNASQFFITTIPAPWLDNKHTVFARVVKGIETVQDIENLKCDDHDKPLREVRLMNIAIQ